jgi:hypothetical protein
LKGVIVAKKIAHEDGKPLMDWAKTHKPSEKLLSGQGYWDQIHFVRGNINYLFVSTDDRCLDKPVMVVGTHSSKSVLLPVYSIKTPNIEVRFKGDFHTWLVSVKLEPVVPIEYYDIFNRSKRIDPVYFEGFIKDWIFGPCDLHQSKFSAEIATDYDLYAFFLIMIGVIRRFPFRN